jgi:hypothetical protein
MTTSMATRCAYWTTSRDCRFECCEVHSRAAIDILSLEHTSIVRLLPAVDIPALGAFLTQYMLSVKYINHSIYILTGVKQFTCIGSHSRDEDV